MGPLAGVRILDFASFIAGPYASSLRLGHSKFETSRRQRKPCRVHSDDVVIGFVEAKTLLLAAAC